MNVKLCSTLMLRNVVWMTTKQAMAEPLLGRPIVEVLALNTKKILAAAADRLHGDIDVDHTLKESETGRKISSVLHDGVSHSDQGIDYSSADVEQDWLDFGIDDPAERRQAIENMLQRPSVAGISGEGLNELREMVTDFDDIFRFRLGPGPPAKVEYIKVEVTASARPIQARQKQYPPVKRTFLNRVVDKFQELGFIKLTTDDEWVSAPLIVPKPPPKNLQMVLDLRSINTVTMSMVWPIHILETEIGDIRESRCIAYIDFASSLWQLPLHSIALFLHTFMTERGVFIPTRTSQGARNSVQNFQGRVTPCFDELRDFLKF